MKMRKIRRRKRGVSYIHTALRKTVSVHNAAAAKAAVTVDHMTMEMLRAPNWCARANPAAVFFVGENHDHLPRQARDKHTPGKIINHD